MNQNQTSHHTPGPHPGQSAFVEAFLKYSKLHLFKRAGAFSSGALFTIYVNYIHNSNYDANNDVFCKLVVY